MGNDLGNLGSSREGAPWRNQTAEDSGESSDFEYSFTDVRGQAKADSKKNQVGSGVGKQMSLRGKGKPVNNEKKKDSGFGHSKTLLGQWKADKKRKESDFEQRSSFDVRGRGKGVNKEKKKKQPVSNGLYTRMGSITGGLSALVRNKNKRNTRKKSSGDKSAPVSKNDAGRKWLEKKREEVLGNDATTPRILQQEFKALFTQLSEQISLTSSRRQITRKTVTKPVFLTLCRKLWGEDIDSYLFSKLFDFMDCDKNGVVDEVEFSVVSCFLLCKSNKTKNTEIAFDLFDSDHNGIMSQQEFSEMLAAVVGTSIDALLLIPAFKPLFEDLLRSKLIGESLDFYNKMCPFFGILPDGTKIFDDIGLQEAKIIANTYLHENSPTCINISHADRLQALEDLKQAEEAGKTMVDGTIFEKCLDEVTYLMESNTLMEFKNSLRDPPYSKVTHDAWKKFGLKEDKGLTFAQFDQWADSQPHLFDFFSRMQTEFTHLIDTLHTKILYTSTKARAKITEEDL